MNEVVKPNFSAEIQHTINPAKRLQAGDQLGDDEKELLKIIEESDSPQETAAYLLSNLLSLSKRTLHPEKWQPDEADKPRIVAELLDYYGATLENCGADDEQTSEAHELYMKVLNRPLAACKDDIQEFFTSCFEAVDGSIEEYYPEELCSLINLTICPE
jgi:hypothetical protein